MFAGVFLSKNKFVSLINRALISLENFINVVLHFKYKNCVIFFANLPTYQFTLLVGLIGL